MTALNLRISRKMQKDAKISSLCHQGHKDDNLHDGIGGLMVSPEAKPPLPNAKPKEHPPTTSTKDNKELIRKQTP